METNRFCSCLAVISIFAFGAVSAVVAQPAGYAVDVQRDLYWVELDTATETLIGATGIADLVEALATDASGNLYATSVPGDLYRLDTSTGAATLVGNHGRGNLEGLDFFNGALLGVDQTRPGGSPQRIYSIDTEDATASIRNILDRGDILSISTLAVRDDRTAFFQGVLTIGFGSLFSVDLATSATTFIGHLASPVSALDFRGSSLYALSFGGKVLRIDPLTAAMEQIGTTAGMQAWLALDIPEPAVGVGECYGTGPGGDNAGLRGIRFRTAKSFTGVELRMEATAPGDYHFVAELRRSDGFTVMPERVSSAAAIGLPGNFSAPPYRTVRMDFGQVPVAGEETFTVRIIPLSGPGGTLVFETFGSGTEPCPQVDETAENNVASPTVIGDPAGFRVIADPLHLRAELVCEAPGITSDSAAIRGIRFTTTRDFRSVELRFDSNQLNEISFDAELRRSPGFAGTPERVATGARAVVPGTLTNHPFSPAVIDFGEPVRVLGSETFTVKLTNIVGTSPLFFETYGIGSTPCPNVEETEQNDVAIPPPEERGDPAGFRLLVDRDQPIPIGWCNNDALGGLNLSFRGIRFTTPEPFNAIELPVDGGLPGIYSFVAELRRSAGFLGNPERVAGPVELPLPGNFSIFPYSELAFIDFGDEPVAPGTFTLKFVEVAGPEAMFFQIGSDPCSGGEVTATLENNVAEPTPSGNPAGLRLTFRPDSDGDAVRDTTDNCLFASNTDQRDTDNDGIGNICDADFDQTCMVNFGDLAVMKSQFISAGEDLVTDLNGDGLVNFGDLARLKQLFLEPPGPAAGPALCP